MTAFCGSGPGVNRLSPLRGRSPREITRKPRDPGCARGDRRASTAETGYEAGFRWCFSACLSAWLIIADAMGCSSSWAALLLPASPASTRPITSGSAPIPMKCSPEVCPGVSGPWRSRRSFPSFRICWWPSSTPRSRSRRRIPPPGWPPPWRQTMCIFAPSAVPTPRLS